MRRAVNIAVDRLAVLRAAGRLTGRATDQILPPGMAGFRDATVFPLARGDAAAARAAALGARGGTAVLYCSNLPESQAEAAVLQYDLRRVGIDVEIHPMPFAALVSRVGTRGEPFDLAIVGWGADYSDPAAFLEPLLDGRMLAASGNLDMSYFHDPATERALDAARRQRGGPRVAAFGRLDVRVMAREAPVLPLFNPTQREFVSARVGCYVWHRSLPVLDLAEVCLRR
jgi:peptide/nickel transport system substrate-binding protein